MLEPLRSTVWCRATLQIIDEHYSQLLWTQSFHVLVGARSVVVLFDTFCCILGDFPWFFSRYLSRGSLTFPLFFFFFSPMAFLGFDIFGQVTEFSSMEEY